MMRKRITKFTVKKGVNTIHWEEYNEQMNDWDAYSMKCKDQPRPELYETLSSFSSSVAEICELPDEYKDKIVPTSVTFRYDENNECLLAITAKMLLPIHGNMELNLNTPAIPENGMEGMPQSGWSDSTSQRVLELEQELWLYINGNRAQTVLALNVETNPMNGVPQINPISA